MGNYKECSCGGNNENCALCSGTGLITRDSFTVDHSYYSLVPRHIDSEHYELCTNCNKLVIGMTMESHRRGKYCRQYKNGEKLVECQFCRVFFEGNVIARHLKSQHNAVLDKNGLLKCPRCSCGVKFSKYLKHLDICKKNPQRKPEKKLIETTKKRNLGQRKQRTEIVASPQKVDSSVVTEKRHDATYGTHIIRDNGQFGSYPSHDSYDDESDA